MCRSTDTKLDGILPRGRNCLKIKAFFVRLKGFKSCKLLPPALTLLYLPRINGSELFVNGSKVRPDSAAFLTLHRAVNVKTKEGEAIFGSREQVWASGGVRFEVYSGDERALEGIFRKDEEDEWNLECKCGLDHEVAVHGGATEVAVAEEADVCVALEGHVALGGRVEMVSRRKKNRRIGFDRLEVIPEERENGVDESVNGCRDDCKYRESDGGGLEKSCESDYDLMEMDLEGVRWAVHVGLWVMCFGVGYLVSKASARSLRRLRLL
ncbi:hypothetical protein JCGZ_20354 [Jatropha curcas]|uniref:Uncharacterized protein n=1 Tax=Jatropha curcas TaxID=180498 RepID=A0A067JQX4_JATCU|nr:uncharacterized protein LOC105645576 [Jatropha curcas]KDP25198.1 hypothetical protein JCGZ_20354 [Jatropha curcas]